MAQQEIPIKQIDIWKQTDLQKIISPDDFIKSYHGFAESLVFKMNAAINLYESSRKSKIIKLISYYQQKFSFREEKNKNSPFTAIEYQSIFTDIIYNFLQQIFFYNFIGYFSKKNYNFHVSPLMSEYLGDNQNPFKFIQNQFIELTKRFEFAPLFKIQESLLEILDNFKNIEINQDIFSFISLCKSLDFELLQTDYYSEFIQQLIPQHAQKAFGQVYTPHKIAKLMVNLSITDPTQTILDPACGCGVLLTESYKKLNKLTQTKYPYIISKKIDETVSYHDQILKQLWGVELHQYPAHLSMLRLAMMDLSVVSTEIGIFTEDFLALGPIQKYMVKTKNLETGEVTSREMPPKFDVIIANPPYIKQEKIPNKVEMIKRLPIYAAYRQENIYSDNLQKIPKKIPLEITGKSDLYGFFLWYSTFFLKSNGTLCFLIPDKWMDVKYGEKIKQFLKDHYCIQTIIAFNKNIFKYAQVSSVILIAQKIESTSAREENIVKFVHIKQNSYDANLITKIQTKLTPQKKNLLDKQGYIFQNDDSNIQCTYIRQNKLASSEKWTYKYLFQSQFSYELNHVRSIKLHNQVLTSVIGGLKTGANDFFFPSIDIQKKFNLDQDFLKRGIKSGRNLPKKFVITSNPNSFLAIPAKFNLQENPNLKNYIEWCETKKKYHQRPSVNWKPWYAIPPSYQIAPDILFLRHINDDFEAKWNQNHCITADGIRGIKVHNPDHLLFYLGICNSLFFYWQAHVEGRWEGQGDLQLLVYELKNFKIPDITLLPKIKVIQVENIMKEYIEIKKKSTNENLRNSDSTLSQSKIKVQEKLDLAVLQCFNLSKYYEMMITELKWLENKRLTKK